MSVHQTLKDAVIAMVGKDDVHCYRITEVEKGDSGGRRIDSYVLSNSPAQAAVEFIGKDNISIVSIKERHDAALAAMMDATKKAGAK
jgi:hypothetical protein